MYDDDEATQYDPNPWGARQRLIPLATFVPAPAPLAPPIVPAAVAYAAPIAYAAPAPMARAAAPAPIAPFARIAYAAAAPAPYAPAARVTLRVPALPMHPRRRARYAIPMFGLAAIVCLAFAYAMKPATIASQTASIATPAIAEPLDMSASGVVAEIAPAELPAIAKPAPRVASRVAHKPRASAKRRPIKIDASITSSPLGHLRPSRR
jgi:hypothetical protein